MSEIARLEAALSHLPMPGLLLHEPGRLCGDGWLAKAHARSFVVAALIEAAGRDPALAERIRSEMLAEARALVEALRDETPKVTTGNVLRFKCRK
jgi:F0F1-type ATP synthase membrane subunit c/vacuolar-type H+-ATPase subunit K